MRQSNDGYILCVALSELFYRRETNLGCNTVIAATGYRYCSPAYASLTASAPASAPATQQRVEIRPFFRLISSTLELLSCVKLRCETCVVRRCTIILDAADLSMRRLLNPRHARCVDKTSLVDMLIRWGGARRWESAHGISFAIVTCSHPRVICRKCCASSTIGCYLVWPLSGHNLRIQYDSRFILNLLTKTPN